MDSLPISPRTIKFGCGIYEVGDPDKCHVKLFIADNGYALPINHRVITEGDLLEVFTQGRLMEREAVEEKGAYWLNKGDSPSDYQ